MNYSKNLDLNDVVYFCEFDKIWKTEQWKDIPDYDGIYQVSDLGRVKSLKRIIYNHGINQFYSKEKILKVALLKNGYFSVALRKNNKQKSIYVHILVAIAFLNHKPCGYKLVINHKNLIKIDNRKLNIEIVTNRENSNQKHLPSSSNYVGVSWSKKLGKWVAYIRINGRVKYLGSFYKELDASIAYQEKLKQISNERI